jgi:cytochrome c556
MRRILTIVIICMAIGSIAYLPVFADHPEKRDIDERTSLMLSKKLQRLLSAEMNSVQQGMTNLAIAIPAGDWKSIEETAGSIRDGYILEKKLSGEELKEFRESLSEEYMRLDQEYKQLAKSMIEAATKGDAEAVNMAFYKLNGTCITCHMKYAKTRFPNFNK